MSSSLSTKYTPKTWDEYIFETGERMRKAIGNQFVKEGVIPRVTILLNLGGKVGKLVNS